MILRTWCAALVVGLVLMASSWAQVQTTQAAVAVFDGTAIHCELTNAALLSCAAELLQSARSRAEQEYLDAHDLRATASEVEAVFAYDRAFRRHDRAQRERKLTELEARLSATNLAPSERIRLQDFRAVLIRLARYEADVDAGIEEAMEIPREAAVQWIEQAKMDADLYRRFGGAVGVRAAGLYAHGGRMALVERYLADHSVEYHVSRFESVLRGLLDRAPDIAFRGTRPDFTPFWLRPIPPSSYVPN